jgi:uncharacterized membrane protein
MPLLFALLHGAVRYRWRGIITFLVVCLVVSNLLENSSTLMGLSFGHHYYTDLLGPKLFLVPLLIGPAYAGNGYPARALSTVLVGDVRPRARAFTTFAVPFVASFIMVTRDLRIDPTNSTNHDRPTRAETPRGDAPRSRRHSSIAQPGDEIPYHIHA